MRVLAATGVAISGGVAAADPWKDESGKGKQRGSYQRHDDGFDRRGRYREAVRIPVSVGRGIRTGPRAINRRPIGADPPRGS